MVASGRLTSISAISYQLVPNSNYFRVSRDVVTSTKNGASTKGGVRLEIDRSTCDPDRIELTFLNHGTKPGLAVKLGTQIPLASKSSLI